jgi:hypothetical protein
METTFDTSCLAFLSCPQRSEDGGPLLKLRLAKLRRANWDAWSITDRDCIRTFLEAWLDHYLERGADYAFEIDSILCGIGLSGDDLAPYLHQLTQFPEALRAYADLNAEALSSKGALVNAFWEAAPERSAPIIRLLCNLH